MVSIGCSRYLTHPRTCRLKPNPLLSTYPTYSRSYLPSTTISTSYPVDRKYNSAILIFLEGWPHRPPKLPRRLPPARPSATLPRNLFQPRPIQIVAGQLYRIMGLQLSQMYVVFCPSSCFGTYHLRYHNRWNIVILTRLWEMRRKYPLFCRVIISEPFIGL